MPDRTGPEPGRPARIPPAPLLLGLGGLVPFWGLGLGLFAAPVLGFSAARIDAALATYAAVILSFLGGIRWGLATPRPEQGRVATHYAVAVGPSLIGWAALALPEPARLGLLGLVILALGPMNAALVHDGLAPPWFRPLRLMLSAGAALGLFAGALALR